MTHGYVTEVLEKFNSPLRAAAPIASVAMPTLAAAAVRSAQASFPDFLGFLLLQLCQHLGEEPEPSVFRAAVYGVHLPVAQGPDAVADVWLALDLAHGVAPLSRHM